MYIWAKSGAGSQAFGSSSASSWPARRAKVIEMSAIIEKIDYEGYYCNCSHTTGDLWPTPQ